MTRAAIERIGQLRAAIAESRREIQDILDDYPLPPEGPAAIVSILTPTDWLALDEWNAQAEPLKERAELGQHFEQRGGAISLDVFFTAVTPTEAAAIRGEIL